MSQQLDDRQQDHLHRADTYARALNLLLTDDERRAPDPAVSSLAERTATEIDQLDAGETWTTSAALIRRWAT